jgi:hypothetical protein
MENWMQGILEEAGVLGALGSLDDNDADADGDDDGSDGGDKEGEEDLSAAFAKTGIE